MSDTVTMPEQETDYPPLSEASEGADVRETSIDIEEEAAPEPEPQVQAQEPEPEPEDDLSARNARLARELREQKRHARQLAEYNQQLQGQRQFTQDEQLQQEINNRAMQLAQQQVVNQKSNDIYQLGVKQYGREFDESVRSMNDAFGQNVMPVVLDTIVDMPDAHRLIQHLGDNPDIADRLASLPPHKLGAALEREAAKLTAPKKVSQAPKPIRPIQTQQTNEPELDYEKMSMDQLAKMWDKRDFIKRFS